MMVLRSRCMCALFLTLTLARPTLSCMKCQKEFDSKFLKYKKDLWGKSSWAGDLVFCQGYIDDWMADVRDGWKHDIPKTDIEEIAIDVYDHMDKQYRLSSTRIGYFPKQLQRINKDMKDRLIKAIKDADRKCKQDCNIHPVAMVNCWTCKERTIQCGVDCSVTSFPTSTLPPTTTPAPEDKTTGILITIVVALFAILGGVGYYLYFGKKKKKEASKEGGDGGNDNEEGEENEKSKDDNDDDKSEG